MRLQRGGRVVALLKLDARGEKLYTYKGVSITGSHLVKDADGIWKRVEDFATPTRVVATTVYNLITEKHRIWVTSNPAHLVSALVGGGGS